MAEEVMVDALPYIDLGYDEAGVRDQALAMVEEEARRYRPTKNYLEHLPFVQSKTFETPIMKAEFERLAHLHLLRERVDLVVATRINNLELMLDYGPATWRLYLDTLQRLLTDGQRKLQSLRKQIQEVNWHRKSIQSRAGEELKSLEGSWVGLISKNFEIELAIAQMEAELAEFRKAEAADQEQPPLDR
ncbi:unnamed protein product [Cyprideis torosa]|uniref:Pre-mRNA-splicing factor SPF27 n=1 Tax=Cyprideis torosa TaxID=163714 RepID=A0A7R8ZM17_9CRUS|nr:unnamed protein product [Cyprideis torosa]CAG0893154.1 unnamed protein product [Cyprideis torosa]